MTERFWSKVDKNGPVPEHCPELGQCWVWTASYRRDGYGQFGYEGKPSVGAHRVAWIFAEGPIPDGLWVLHHCDNKLCVRRSHLFLGTRTDNIRDMHDKDRHWKGPAMCVAGLHDLTVPGNRNTGANRGCRLCKRARDARPRGGQ